MKRYRVERCDDAGTLTREDGTQVDHTWSVVEIIDPAPRGESGDVVREMSNHDTRKQAREALQRYVTDDYLADRKADEGRLIGTPRYRGVGYFWAMAYKVPMRDLTPAKRRRVHAALLAANLPLDGESDAHAAIIWRIAGDMSKFYGSVQP